MRDTKLYDRYFQTVVLIAFLVLTSPSLKHAYTYFIIPAGVVIVVNFRILLSVGWIRWLSLWNLILVQYSILGTLLVKGIQGEY